MASSAGALGIVQLMAIQTADHGVDAFHVGHHLHLADVAVAGLALHSRVQMRAMAPRHSWQDSVNSHPGHCRFRFVIRREFLNTRPVFSEGGMALHAGAGIGEGHQSAATGIAMAQLALQPQRQMSFVAIRKRLLGRRERHGSVMNVLADRLRLSCLRMEGRLPATEKEYRQSYSGQRRQSKISIHSLHDSPSIFMTH